MYIVHVHIVYRLLPTQRLRYHCGRVIRTKGKVYDNLQQQSIFSIRPPTHFTRNSFAQRQPTYLFLHIVSERDTILRGKHSATY